MVLKPNGAKSPFTFLLKTIKEKKQNLQKYFLDFLQNIVCCFLFQVSVYNKFWLRFANVPFSLDKFDVYEKHFTVMNYSNAHLEQVQLIN